MQCKRCQQRPAVTLDRLCDPCHISGGRAGEGWDAVEEMSPYFEGWHPDQKPRTQS